MKQIERLRYVCEKIKKRDNYSFDKLPIHQKICIKQLEILEKNPEYEGKLNHFVECDVFCTSSKNVIIYLEIDKIVKIG